METKKIFIVLGVLVFLGCVAASTVVLMFISANNYGVKAEASIVAAYDNNRNLLSAKSQKIAEIAQVPTMYVDDLTKVFTSEVKARYGDKGSIGTMQFLQEHNIPFDSSMYKQIQQVIEASRTDFQAGQTMLIDRKRAYQTELGKFPRGIFMSVLGFPKIDLTKYDIVTDTGTEKAFATKLDVPQQLRPQK